MFGCQQHTGSNTQSETKQSEASSDVAVESQSVIKKQVPYIGDFFQITNMSDFDIEFTQGDYDVVIEAPATIANILRTSFDCGIITFSQLEEARHTTYNTSLSQSIGTIHVSCPDLQVVAVCGKGNFHTTSPIHSSSLHIGLLSTANISLDSVVCDDFFKYETSNDGNATFSYVQTGGDATLLPNNNGLTSAHINAKGALYVNTGGNGQNTITAHARTADIGTMDASTCTLTLDADSLHLFALGESTVCLSGDIRNKEIKQSKNATVTER